MSRRLSKNSSKIKDVVSWHEACIDQARRIALCFHSNRRQDMTNPTRRLAVIALACAASLAASVATAQASKGEIRIAHVYDKTGPLEAYAKQTHTGLMMGLNYATQGTMMVNGKKLVVIEKDSQFKPDVGKAQL